MLRDKQYEYFMFLFNQGRSRYIELVNRGKIFISIISLYFGLLAVAADKTVNKLSENKFMIVI